MDSEPGFDEIFTRAYDALRQLAAAKLTRQPGSSLQPTALVHEAYLRFAGKDHHFENEGHLMGAMAAAMRHILIDRARRRLAGKRGGGAVREPLDHIAAPGPDEELLALDEALDRLAQTDPRKAKLVELRHFAGLTGDEAARVLGISPATADRDWAFARAWLQTQLRSEESGQA
jgi:RNA polymerase sigma factor (TIGR02999 family)